MTEFFDPIGTLSKVLEKYEPREGQQKMADAVTELVSVDRSEIYELQSRADVLVVEAETGIGKTMAYLVPAILSGKRVVVSTATLNLQDQIIAKEIPLIEKALNREIHVMCIKGRQNYLCLYRWYQFKASPQLSLVEDSYSERIEDWLDQTETGDRAELEWLPDRSGLWAKISAQSNQCLGGECPEAANCFINLLRKRAAHASLLVVNHHLFFSDLALRQAGFGEVLPRYEGVIFDEAHHLENTATTFFGKSFSQFQVVDLLADIERQAESDLDPDRYGKIVGSVRGLKKRTEEFAALFPARFGKFPLLDFIETLSQSAWQTEVDLLAMGLERISEQLAQCRQQGDGWSHLEKRAGELRQNLLDIAFPLISEGAESFVHWYERRERSIALSATPVKVAELLKNSLYQSVAWCLMTSATLSSDGDFSYMQERLGLDKDTPCMRFLSPFDFQNRTLLYVPEKGFPEPSAPNYQEQAAHKACELLKCSNGRGLVLCTSFRAMEFMAEYLEEHLEYQILVQGRGARNALLKRFRSEKHSVLIAVASFWEGVDVQGDALSCVIIDKLPFEVPTDPVIQARIKAITDCGGNAFFDFQVPRAILTLRQGFGRLMRSASDCGVVAILDVRLFTKSYGRRFRNSLPPSPTVRAIDPVLKFYSNYSQAPHL